MYNAFISYSHEADEKFAPALQNALQKFAKPWYKKRNLEIFRDESSLSASPHLWDNITKALDKSEYLVLLASPLSENSHWVNEEVKYWLEHKSVDTILLALTDGEITWDTKNKRFLNSDNNSLPPALDYVFKDEPFYIDLRQSKSEEDLSLDNPIFKKEVLKLAAKLHNKAPNDLASEEVTVHKKMILIRNSIGITLLVFLGVSIFQTINANKHTKIAVQERENAQKQTKIAKEQRDRAQANYLNLESKRLVMENPTIALRLAENPWRKNPQDLDFQKDVHKIYAEQIFYKSIGKNNSLRRPFAFSPDGTKILSSSLNGTAHLWDTRGDHLELPIALPGGFYSSVAFSPDGTKFLTANDSTAHIWNLQGRELMKFEGKSSMDLVAFSPDGKKVLTSTRDDTIILWDIRGTELMKIEGQISDVGAISFSNEGNRFLVSSSDGEILMFDVKGKVLKKIYVLKKDWPFTCQAFSPDGTKILFGSDDGNIHLWNLQGRELMNFKGSETEVYSVAFSHDGTKVLAGYGDGNSFILNLEGEVLAKLLAYENEDQYAPRVMYVGFSPDGTKVLTNNWTGTTNLWNLKGTELKKWVAHSGAVNSVAFSPDGTKILTGSRDRTAYLWDLQGVKLMKFESVMDTVSSVAFSPNGTNILVGYRDGTARLWDLQGMEIMKFEGHTDRASPVLFSPDGTKVIIASQWDGTVQLWDLQRKELMKFDAENVSSVAFSIDGDNVLIGYTDAKVRLVNLQGTLLQAFESELADVVISVAFSPDGSKVLAFDRYNEGNIWDQHGNSMKYFEMNMDEITSVGHGNMDAAFSAPFSPDGCRILTVSMNNIARLWDVDGNLLKKFDGVKANSVAFSPDGNKILIGSIDGSVSLWLTTIPLYDFLNSDQLETLSAELKVKYGIE